MAFLIAFLITLLSLTVVIRFIYYKRTGNKDYLFTFYMIGIVVFFISLSLKSVDLGLGMALGLFAVFGIIRYRTNVIPIKEMTYLFIVIGISLINGVSVHEESAQIMALGGNAFILIITAILENVWLKGKDESKHIVFEHIELIKPENREALITNLEERTGLEITRVNVGKIDFLRDVADITIFYKSDEND